MLIDFTAKRFCIFGLQGSGKTYLAKHILKHTTNGWVIDVLGEYRGFNRYKMRDRSFKGRAELDKALAYLIKKKQPSMIIIDEANRYCPLHHPLPDMVLNLNDFNRHYGVAVGFIARRPVQLNPDLVELAHYLFIFKLVGKSDLAYMDKLHPELRDKVMSLGQHEFVFYDRTTMNIVKMKV